MQCPLCLKENVCLKEKILKKDIVKLYKQKFNIKVRELLKAEVIEYLECRTCGLLFFNPPSAGDEQFYNSFQKFDWYYMEEKEEFSYAVNYIKESDKVLEIGSGKGAFAKKIATKNYVGLEFSKAACNLAAQNGVKVINESIDQHALTNSETYDVVCHFQVLEHVDNIHVFLEQCVKALKVSGLLIISVPSEDSFWRYIVNPYLNLPPHHASHWPDQTMNYIQQIYPLKLEYLYHEKVASMHSELYIRTLIEHSLRKIFKLKQKLVDTSCKSKIIKFLGFIFAKILVKGLQDEFKGNGHSLVAVYRKVNNK